MGYLKLDGTLKFKIKLVLSLSLILDNFINRHLIIQEVVKISTLFFITISRF